MFISIITLALLSFVLATMLIVAHKKWHVEENPLYDQVDEMLPQANCGACGYAGCRAFAEALVDNKAKPGLCSVSPPESLETIALFLGVDIGKQEKIVARLACAGGQNVAKQHALYAGLKTCRAATLVAGGGKSCSWGCLGLGDCAVSCQFNAITMDENLLPVVAENLCTGCNDCVEVCPKDLFSLHPSSHRLWVACKNQESGDELITICQAACTACARCAHDADNELITMQHNLPMVDYSKNHHTQQPIQHCPTGAIVWLTQQGEHIKGPSAKKTIRHSAVELDYS